MNHLEEETKSVFSKCVYVNKFYWTVHQSSSFMCKMMNTVTLSFHVFYIINIESYCGGHVG